MWFFGIVQLTLHNVSIPEDGLLAEKLDTILFGLKEVLKLKFNSWELSDYNKEAPLKKHVHIVIHIGTLNPSSFSESNSV